jgi:hypothetical protein
MHVKMTIRIRSVCDGMCVWKDAEVEAEDDRFVCSCIRMIGNIDTDNKGTLIYILM